MKTTILFCMMAFGLALYLSGCAQRTVHERCSDPQVSSRYKDYGQCYAEIGKEEEERKARGNVFQAFSEGFQKGYNNSDAKATSCTTTTFGNRASTHCD